jgi:DNA-binding NtrC family response regulator
MMDHPGTILLIDDEPAQQRLTAAILARGGWTVDTAADGEDALARINQTPARPLAAVVIDHALPGNAGTALVGTIHAARPELPLLMLTAQSSVAGAVAAMRAGATDFLAKPIAADRLLAALAAATARDGGGEELRPLSEKLRQPLGFDEIVGSTPAFRAALAIAAKAARTRTPILIEGESGVGKEVVAEAIHAASPRARRPMVVVDCAAFPAAQIEGELFGQAHDGFASADRRPGRIVEADGSTLFLDEVGALPAEAQLKLLRLLEAGEVQPLDGRPVALDVRVIAATNRPLDADVAAGRFSADLHARLTAVQVTIPPLAKRSADMPALARHLLSRIAAQPGMRRLGITEDALSLLMAYRWPGNVRQLQNALFRAALRCDGDMLSPADFPQIARETSGAISDQALAQAQPLAGVTLFETNGHLRSLDAIEGDIIRLAIGHYRGRMTEVARRLGIGRSTLYRKLGELGIDHAA